jgi:gamma-glutamylcyclotransferase (GGCT)/AIG2-like uncharacterized protein YtfP
LQHLILYGSLRRGLPGHRRLGLGRALRFVRQVTLAGRLYDLGDYPGLVSTEPGRVTGELFAIEDAAILPVLDRFEGADYRREIVQTGAVSALVYVFIGLTAGRPVVSSGDWLAPG